MLYGEFLTKMLTIGTARPDMHRVKASSLARCPDLEGLNEGRSSVLLMEVVFVPLLPQL